jgi:hypothetical protein
MTVRYLSSDPQGLEAMIGDLIRQNLAREPARRRLLRPARVRLTATDAGVEVTVRISRGRVVVSSGGGGRSHVWISADSSRLLALTSVPLRFGLPDPRSPEGRGVIADVFARRVRIRGMLTHPRRLARLALLLSAR